MAITENKPVTKELIVKDLISYLSKCNQYGKVILGINYDEQQNNGVPFLEVTENNLDGQLYIEPSKDVFETNKLLYDIHTK